MFKQPFLTDEQAARALVVMGEEEERILKRKTLQVIVQSKDLEHNATSLNDMKREERNENIKQLGIPREVLDEMIQEEKEKESTFFLLWNDQDEKTSILSTRDDEKDRSHFHKEESFTSTKPPSSSARLQNWEIDSGMKEYILKHLKGSYVNYKREDRVNIKVPDDIPTLVSIPSILSSSSSPSKQSSSNNNAPPSYRISREILKQAILSHPRLAMASVSIGHSSFLTQEIRVLSLVLQEMGCFTPFPIDPLTRRFTALFSKHESDFKTFKIVQVHSGNNIKVHCLTPGTEISQVVKRSKSGSGSFELKGNEKNVIYSGNILVVPPWTAVVLETLESSTDDNDDLKASTITVNTILPPMIGLLQEPEDEEERKDFKRALKIAKSEWRKNILIIDPLSILNKNDETMKAIDHTTVVIFDKGIEIALLRLSEGTKVDMEMHMETTQLLRLLHGKATIGVSPTWLENTVSVQTVFKKPSGLLAFDLTETTTSSVAGIVNLKEKGDVCVISPGSFHTIQDGSVRWGSLFLSIYIGTSIENPRRSFRNWSGIEQDELKIKKAIALSISTTTTN